MRLTTYLAKQQTEREKMNNCDMAGCVDIAEYTAEFTDEKGADQNALTLEVCESCANFWGEKDTVLIKRFANG